MDDKQVARDILHHMKKKNLKYWRTRSEIKKGISNTLDGGIYNSSHAIGHGVRYLLSKGIFVHVSVTKFMLTGERE